MLCVAMVRSPLKQYRFTLFPYLVLSLILKKYQMWIALTSTVSISIYDISLFTQVEEISLTISQYESATCALGPTLIHALLVFSF